MGSTIHVRCVACDRRGDELSWGVGMSWHWELFEHRLFHCPKCDGLRTASVLRRDKDLKAALEADPARWAARVDLSLGQLAALVMDARRWPRCGKDCGGRLQGSVGADPETGAPTGCPACGGELAVTDGAALWD